MSFQHGGGVLTISIDLEFDVQDRLHVRQSEMATLVSRSLSVLRALKLPATWAVADPVHSAATDEILASNTKHEIAVLGDETWVGASAGRMRFAHELSRRVESARAAGYAVSTLALRGVQLEDHSDLLVKQRISAVRQAGIDLRNQTQLVRPQSVRFGVWNVSGSHGIPQTGRRWIGSGLISLRHAVNQSIRQNRVVHLVIDGPAVVDDNLRALRTLERFLSYAKRQQDRGLLKVATIQQLVSRFSQPRIKPARSVLRNAA